MRLWSSYRFLLGLLAVSNLLAGQLSSIYPELWVHDRLLISPRVDSSSGAYAGLDATTGSLALGSLSIPFPLELSKERGDILYSPLPSYSHRGTRSEWGRGWDAPLRIYRYSDAGEVNCQADLFASPWGKLKQSSRSGVFFPAGFEVDVEVTKQSSGFTAVHPDGHRLEFSKNFGDYAWYLTQVTNCQGHKTELFYKLNEYGRPILKTVQYGGKRQRQYEIEFVYEALSVPVKLYESCGLNASITERVSEVILRHWDGFQFVLAKTLSLKHRDGYLEEIIHRFPNGSELPPIRYHYDGIEKYLAHSYKTSPTNFTDFLGGLRNRNFFSTSVSYVDLNQDGLLDIERGDDLRSFIMQPGGQFQPRAEAAPFIPQGACQWKPEWGRRLISRLAGPESELSYVFLRNDTDGRGTNTHLIACSLQGEPRYEKKIFDIFRSGFSFSDTTHFVDINRDFKPDLVRVEKNGLTVFLNESTSSEIRFSEKISKPLQSLHHPHIKSFYLLDINSDNFVDLVAQVKYGILVWYGRGDLSFESSPTYITFTALRIPAVDISDGDLSFIDINKDGLVDCLLTLDSTPFVFINEGERFYRKPFPGFKNLPLLSGYPRLLNVNGTLEEQLSLWAPSTGMIYFDLNNASTGLLTHIDNGQGIEFDFEYQWTKPKPGIPNPLIVPKSLQVATVGLGVKKTEFRFEDPQVNLATGQFLGFGHVETAGADISMEISYFLGREHAPKSIEIRKHDKRVPDLVEVESHKWGQAELEGIPFPRLIQKVLSYFSSSGTTRSVLEEILDYHRLCPSHLSKETTSGILETLVSYFDPRSCLKTNETLIGPDFSYTSLITYNQAGLPTNLELATGHERLPKMALGYDEELNLKNVTQPGKGAIFLHYDPVFEILNLLQFPDGTYREMVGYSAGADAVSGLSSKSSGTEPLNQTFVYDEFYRLKETANNLGQQSQYSYRLPNQTFPGVLSEALTKTAILSDAAGEILTKGKQAQHNWHFEPLHRKNLAQGKEYQIDISSLDRNPLELTFQELESAQTVISATETSELFGILAKESAVNSNHRNYIQNQFEVDAAGFKTISKENKQYVTQSILDLSTFQQVSFTDELNETYAFERDVLGRLSKITLPDGNTQMVGFDGFGRVANISRSNIGDVIYTYDNTHDRLAKKTILGTIETYDYDDAGRMALLVRDSDSFRFGYEGSAITSVQHADFTKKFSYAPDDKPRLKQLTTKSGLSIELDHEYDGFRNLIQQNVSNRYTKHFVNDDYRQLGLVRIGNQTFSLKRDRHGKLFEVGLPNNQTFNVYYDPLTHGRIGHSSNQGSYSWNLNDRGLIEHTHFSASADTCDPTMLNFVYAPDKTLQTNLVSIPTEAPLLSRRVNSLYDENRHRIGKYKDDQLEYIRFEGIVATAEHIYEKFSIEGIDLGILIDGQFQLCLFDQVGSLLAIGDWISIPLPFGERKEYATIFEYFDYAGHGRDPHTGYITMGERDYDPSTHQFTSPDRFFLENPEECVRSPQECDLFSYAKNNPLIYTDSDGKTAVIKGGIYAGFLAYNAYQFYKEQSRENAISLGLSIAGPLVATRAGSIIKGIIQVKDSASSAVNGKRLAEQLRMESSGRSSPIPAEPKNVYSARELIRRAEESGPYHNFPGSFDDIILKNPPQKISDSYWKYTEPGMINGRAGTFELGVKPAPNGNLITKHRFFKPDKGGI
jgi:RHS repeat-associated protein